jgi:hypothetical protein
LLHQTPRKGGNAETNSPKAQLHNCISITVPFASDDILRFTTKLPKPITNNQTEKIFSTKQQQSMALPEKLSTKTNSQTVLPLHNLTSIAAVVINFFSALFGEINQPTAKPFLPKRQKKTSRATINNQIVTKASATDKRRKRTGTNQQPNRRLRGERVWRAQRSRQSSRYCLTLVYCSKR